MNTLSKSCKLNKKRLYLDPELSKINSYIIINGSSYSYRNSDVEYKFRQNSNFYWLTGINEPNYKLAINCYEKRIIIVPPVFNELDLIWDNTIPDFKLMKNDFEYDEILFDLSGINIDYVNLSINQKLLLDKIEEYRVIKNRHEIKLMQSACINSQSTHDNLMQTIVTYVDNNEKLIQKQFIYFTECLKNVTGQSYNPICATGTNSSILHYSKNNSNLKFGDLFLIDAGCEYLNYASDITRTYGIGEIDCYKKKIIEIVTEINIKCKELVKDNVNFKDIYNKCMDLIKENILLLKIVKDEFKNDQLLGEIFMPHGLGHFIGLDVHDVGGKLYDKINDHSIILKENMVITIEPGIYFNNYLLNKHNHMWTEEINNFKDIGGVRIEDVVVVKKDGYEQLN